MRIHEDPSKIKQLLMTSFPVKNDNGSKKKFGVIKDLELNFHMRQSALHYFVFVGLRNYQTETMFSIFKLRKIDQNGRKLDNQKLFHTKSST